MLNCCRFADDGGVVRREQRVGERPQRNAVVEQPVTAAHHRAARRKRGPRKAGARRNVPGLSRDGLQKFQIVANAEIQGEVGSHLVLILRVEADVGIRLVDLRYAERLRETGAVVNAAQKVGERGERIAAANRCAET